MQLYTYLDIIKNFLALIASIIYVLALIVVLIKEHTKNTRHEYYQHNYDTEKDIKRKIEREQEKLNRFLKRQEKKVQRLKKL